jgi:putative transposase
MPSHFHWVFEPLPAWVATFDPVGQVSKPAANNDDAASSRSIEPASTRTARERIMHSVKLHSARECNRLLGRRGRFWQDESYDHWVRDVDELERLIQYVEYNPVRAGLCESPEAWAFSSAFDRVKLGLELGASLRRSEKAPD